MSTKLREPHVRLFLAVSAISWSIIQIGLVTGSILRQEGDDSSSYVVFDKNVVVGLAANVDVAAIITSASNAASRYMPYGAQERRNIDAMNGSRHEVGIRDSCGVGRASAPVPFSPQLGTTLLRVVLPRLLGSLVHSMPPLTIVAPMHGAHASSPGATIVIYLQRR